MSVKISICIPTFNRSSFLAEALESIENNIQDSECSIEIVVSDNCSTDDTAEVVKEFSKRIPILYSRNKKNIGAVSNLIRSTELSSGELLWLFADDDIMKKGAISYLYHFLELNTDVDYLFYPRELYDVVGKKDGRIQPSGVETDLLFDDGRELLVALNGEMAPIMGFFSSTLIRSQLWKSSVDVQDVQNIEDRDQLLYLRAIFRAICDKKCAVLAKTGVKCRLGNNRPFNVNSKVWFDEYLRCFVYAERIGYDAHACRKAMNNIALDFSKAVVVDKAKGKRNDNIGKVFCKLHTPHTIEKKFPWYYMSFLPPKALSVAFLGYKLFVRIRASRQGDFPGK